MLADDRRSGGMNCLQRPLAATERAFGIMLVVMAFLIRMKFST